MSVEIHMPDMEQVLTAALQSKIDAALSAADEVRPLIVQKVLLENTDADGNVMPVKKPKPAKSPKNNPNAPLVETGDMLDRARWSVSKEEHSATVTYTPPEHYQYLIAKNRPWLTHDRMNSDVRKQIEALMVERLKAGA